MVLKAFKYRIYPDKKQYIQLAKTFGCVRFVYNYYLHMKKELYENEKKTMSKNDCNNHLNRVLKKSDEYKWLKEVDKFALTNAIYNLDNAFQNFFREIKKGNKNQGYPKFKNKKENRFSYTTNFTNNNIEVDFENNKIKLPKLKWIEAKVHRKFDGKIKSATVSKTPSNKYFVSILIDTEINQLPKNNNKIGFDLGIKEFLIDSNGNHVENPKHLYKYEWKLVKLQRQHAKKKIGSNNWNKHKIKIARLHEKITNVRKDFLHKLSSLIINENQVIISEDLQVFNMVRNHQLAKAINDVSWGEFTRQLKYKANWYGRTYHKISPWFASSQTCSNCGHKNKEVKKLNVRQWVCSECRSIHHRDENAAVNILNQGLKELNLV
ncbi:IS200/IS605 family element RNA-guided endonuclease TnpB [Bacillus smithii]|uniref:IS200/IS605 family element RNA-guided endonuclease TnpB n=1 Tax=Bacillus smithii TaxID=1479 RepID=UPI003D210F73